MLIFEFLFWISVTAILHTYVIYPFFLKIFSSKKKMNKIIFYRKDNLPVVSVLLSVFNEEEVIENKIISVFKTNYPKSKLEFIIGSDNSTDKTDEIIKNFKKKFKNLYFFTYKKRQGKGNIINQLIDKSVGDILILTDANVMFDENTIFNLIKHFKNKEIGLVDTQMINKNFKKEGISLQEKSYISREVKIKNMESKLWGTMMGPFGGCYAIRRYLYSKIPENYLVDDFYINMKVFEKGRKAINELNAKVYEDVSNNLKDEFHRKIRISTGNFQNLFTFWRLLFPIYSAISFSFLSHKVLRWLGSFFILIIYFSNIFLYSNHILYKISFYLLNILFFLPLIDFILKKVNIHISILRFITHFLFMNLALFIGFFKFLKGVKNNVWQPTKRNQ
ncbi:MAG: hypothetical protein B6I24_01830 [Bacteroidetes bacterium 4572_128]|nr:MAG: hypothetical protein B6I24_01830 [Bacteroidetes bacterium 4572_128]